MVSKGILAALLLLLTSFVEISTCSELALWKNLLTHKPSDSVKGKIAGLKRDFELQMLEDAGGEIINLDYFPVVIRTFPKKPSTDIAFTPEEFLTHLRLNFNDFVNQKYGQFTPSVKTGFNEDSLWKSRNPVGAIIHIYIPLPAGDGSVICTEIATDHWVYGTLRTPWRPMSTGYDGKHPVSGYRQVGFTKNTDGTYTYYTKGIDRINGKIPAKVAGIFMKNPFKGADNLWFSLRNGIYNYVQQNGGSAVPLDSAPVEFNRYNWDEVKDCFSEEKNGADDK